MVTMANTCKPIKVALCCLCKIAPMIGRPVRVLLNISTVKTIEQRSNGANEDIRDSYNTLISTDLSPQGLEAAGLRATWQHDANEGAAEKAVRHSKNDEAGIGRMVIERQP